MNKERLSRVIANMTKRGVKQLLISDPDSIWYLSGIGYEPGERLLALYVSRYARAELADDTPFTVRGADEMRALGVRAIVLPLVALIVSAILHKSFGAALLSDIDGGLSAVIGVVLLLVSLLLRCGAEQTAEAR